MVQMEAESAAHGSDFANKCCDATEGHLKAGFCIALRQILARRPTTQDARDGFYIQDSRQMVGNCMLFWRPNRSGYTTDIDEAGVYTREEAYSQHKSRDTDVPWTVAYIRSHAKPRVDFQYVNKANAILAEGKA